MDIGENVNNRHLLAPWAIAAVGFSARLGLQLREVFPSFGELCDNLNVGIMGWIVLKFAEIAY